MARSYRPHDLHAAAAEPLTLAAQGHLWVGGSLIPTPMGLAMRGQMYVEYWIPQDLRHPLPLVLIHGGGGQGTDYLATADGGEGWLHWFVRRGHAVYVVDRPQHGRSPFHPDIQGAMASPMPTGFLEEWFARPRDFGRWPQARLHDQWPGDGTLEDPAFLSFLASGGPPLRDLEQAHRDCRHAGAELLDRIGPAILLTHSAGGPMGWLVADARPELVRALVAVEPVGPPFTDRAGGKLSWGLAAAPLAYDPAAGSADDLATEPNTAHAEGLTTCLVQAAPVRRLPNLARVPVAVVTAEASFKALDDHGTVDFLRQAGVEVEHIRLADHAVHGNGHAMMLERNAAEVAAVIEAWTLKASGG